MLTMTLALPGGRDELNKFRQKVKLLEMTSLDFNPLDSRPRFAQSYPGPHRHRLCRLVYDRDPYKHLFNP